VIWSKVWYTAVSCVEHNGYDYFNVLRRSFSGQTCADRDIGRHVHRQPWCVNRVLHGHLGKHRTVVGRCDSRLTGAQLPAAAPACMALSSAQTVRRGSAKSGPGCVAAETKNTLVTSVYPHSLKSWSSSAKTKIYAQLSVLKTQTQLLNQHCRTSKPLHLWTSSWLYTFYVFAVLLMQTKKKALKWLYMYAVGQCLECVVN